MEFFVNKLGPIPTVTPEMIERANAARNAADAKVSGQTTTQRQQTSQQQVRQATPASAPPPPAPAPEPKKKKGWF